MLQKEPVWKEIILCAENEKHVDEINPEFIKGLKFHYVDRMQEVLNINLGTKFPTSNNKSTKKASAK
ncbi:MAG: S16 family serine protease [Saprospiraceae bacterium]